MPSTFNVPMLSPDSYVYVIRKSSDLYWEYNILSDIEKAQLEQEIGAGKVNLTEAPWWDSPTPILTYIAGEDGINVPTPAIGVTSYALVKSAKALRGNIVDGKIVGDGIISFFSDGNVLGTVLNAIGYNIAANVLETSDSDVREIQKATLGNDGELFKHSNTPVLIKAGKSYFPKKLIAKIRDEMLKRGKFYIDTVQPVATEPYKVSSNATVKDMIDNIFKQVGLPPHTFQPESGDYDFNSLIKNNRIYGEVVISMQYTGNPPKPYQYGTFTIKLWNSPANGWMGEEQIFGVGSLVKPLTSKDTTRYISIDNTTPIYYYEYSGVGSATSNIIKVHRVTKKTTTPNKLKVVAGGYNEYLTTTGSFTASYNAHYGTPNLIGMNGKPITGVTATDAVKDGAFDDAYSDWVEKAISVPVGIDSDEKEDWLPISIPSGIPLVEGIDDTAEKTQVGAIPDAITETISEVLDNTVDISIPKTDTGVAVLPNPAPTPLPAIPSMVPSVDLGLAQLYNPTIAQLKSFSRWLWGTEFDLTQFKKLFGDPMQAIIGLHAIYATPVEGGASTIQLGYINSGVTSQVVKDMFTTINCGTVHIPESFGDVRDYNPYTSVDIYLPFIGMQQLNTDDIMGGDVTVTYKVDVLTGSCIALISVKSSKVNGILYSFTGNCAIQLPITSGNYMQAVSSLITGIAKTVAGAAAGGLAGGLAGAANGVTGLDKTSVHVSGGLTSNAGAMGVKKPYIIIRKPIGADATRYNEFYGYSANKYVSLSQLRGFTRIKDINLSVTGATQDEQNEIVTLLKEGVIL